MRCQKIDKSYLVESEVKLDLKFYPQENLYELEWYYVGQQGGTDDSKEIIYDGGGVNG